MIFKLAGEAERGEEKVNSVSQWQTRTKNKLKKTHKKQQHKNKKKKKKKKGLVE